MKSKFNLRKIALGVTLIVGCYTYKGNVMASMTELYKNQTLNGKHVGAYVPPSEYKLPEGFNIPQGKKISTSNGSIEVQLQKSGVNINIPADKLIMYKGSKEASKMAANTANLQYVVDAVSNAGGGVVKVAAGDYYMTMGNSDGVITAKNNVTIAGTLGSDGDLLTTFFPYGTHEQGLNMFRNDRPNPLVKEDYNVYTKEQLDAIDEEGFLINADFRDFRIDGVYVKTEGAFLAQGKGFSFVIVKDCDWYNVEVQNTNGTGFGMDELRNSNVINCSANACGTYNYTNGQGGFVDEEPSVKSHVGASGFGIGYGYRKDESINVMYCLATNCQRFGIFFECQHRFLWAKKEMQHLAVDNLYAGNNICAGNRFNMGGEYCFKAVFDRNISKKNSEEYGYPNPMKITNENVHYRFGKNETNVEDKNNGINIVSRNNTVILRDGTTLNLPEYSEEEAINDVYNENILAGITDSFGHPIGYKTDSNDPKFIDSPCTSWNHNPIHFVIAANYIDPISSTEFGAKNEVTRGEMVESLYRICGRPNTNYTNLYIDVPSNHKYANSIIWAYNSNIAKGYQNGTDTFGPDDTITRRDACIMLYRYAKLIDPAVNSTGDLSKYSGNDQVTVQEHKEAMAWCLDAGIISIKLNEETGEKEILPGAALYKDELSAMIFKFVNFVENTKVELQSISFTNVPSAMNVGDTLDVAISYNPANTTDSKEFTVKSSNTNIISVNGKKITAKAAGKATITATCNDKTASIEITVSAAQEFLKGDVTKDKFVNSTDAAMVLDIFKNNNATQEDFKRGDMDNNNILNATDASLILDLFKNGHL